MTTNSSLPVVAFVFARGGSKDVPGKNLRLAGGIPLIGHSIRCAKSCPSVSRVVVSTDCDEIADVARSFGAEVPFMRPATLAADDAPELLAWQHALDTLESAGDSIGTFVSLPATSPLRSPDDVENCLRVLDGSKCDLVLTVTPAHRSPYFNMVTVGPDGRVALLGDAGKIVRRQDAPAAFDVTTVAYAATPAFVRRARNLWDGDLRACVVPQERALDIDSEWDLKVANLIVREMAANV